MCNRVNYVMYYGTEGVAIFLGYEKALTSRKPRKKMKNLQAIEVVKRNCSMYNHLSFHHYLKLTAVCTVLSFIFV